MTRDEFIDLMLERGISRRTAESSWRTHHVELSLVTAEEMDRALAEACKAIARMREIQ